MPTTTQQTRLLAAAAAFLLAVPGLAAEPASTPGTQYAYFKNGKKVPLFAESSGRTPIARVGDDVVALAELVDALATAHQEHGQAQGAQRDLAPVVGRLVDVRLVILEARAMGLQDLPEHKAALASFREATLRRALQQRVVARVAVPRKEVERRYREAVRQWRLVSALFPKAEDARALREAVRGGGDFSALVKKAIADGRAQGTAEPELLAERKMLPPVVEAVKKLRQGEVSEPVAVPGGTALFQVLGERIPEDREARAKAWKEVAEPRQRDALGKYLQGLEKKYVRIDKRMLAGLDFESKTPGIEALAKDLRPVARIEGEPPVTVADMVGEMRKKLYHGLDQAAESKKLNSRKKDIVDAILEHRVPLKEARRLGLDRTEDFTFQVKQFGDQLLFTGYLQKAIAPTVSASDQELRAEYDGHPGDYSFPEFFRLESLAFAGARQAQAVHQKLRAGADFKFMAQNAEGQLPAEKQTVHFDPSTTVSAGEFNPELARAMSGAREGDYRLYADPAGPQYVIHVVARTPPQTQPFAAVEDTVRKKVFQRKLNQAIQEAVGKMRQSYPVDVLIARIGE